MKYNS
jgi:serine/threonine protein kinase